jgi:predicted amidohydrolase YtcJ
MRIQPTHILFNGQIVTHPDREETTGALALAHDRILAAGTNEEIRGLASDGCIQTDLGGRIVWPGLTDAHIHLMKYAHSFHLLDCEVESRQRCLQLVEEAVANSEPGQWILGHGWNHNHWDRYGTAEELDQIAPYNPVYLTAKSLHAGWANSLALQLANITKSTPDPDRGHIQRDAGGRPTGIVLERAMLLIRDSIPKPPIEQVAKELDEAQHKLWKLGVVGVHDFDSLVCFKALQHLRRQNKLGLRVVKNVRDDDLEIALLAGLVTGLGDEWLRIGNAKQFADGALGPQTAAMLSPYEDSQDVGMLLLNEEALNEIGQRAVKAGLALTYHAIGDYANRVVLDSFTKLREIEASLGIAPLPHRIEHLQLLHPDDLHRPGEIGVTCSMQPRHAPSDREMADRYWGSRVRYAYAWKSLLDHGANLAFGSDAPVESPNPFWGIHAALTRQPLERKPSQPSWVPEERLNWHEALSAYTVGPAKAAGMEGRLGRLIPNFLADLIVFEKDPMQLDVDELIDLRPVGTMVGGEWKYRNFD